MASHLIGENLEGECVKRLERGGGGLSRCCLVRRRYIKIEREKKS